MIDTTGILYITATPIGNMEDITYRAVRYLREEIEAIYCEDTRQTRKILNYYEIKHPVYSLHSHSGENVINGAIKLLISGKNIAYITDCGTPAVSDPGSRLVSAAVQAGIVISPLPGASALTSLLSVCGLPGKNIIFAGFISKKPGRRIHELEALKSFSGTIIFYESPHRIKKTILALAEVFPGQNIVIGREMTKIFEEFIRGKIEDIIENIESLKEKGEFSIAVDNDI